VVAVSLVHEPTTRRDPAVGWQCRLPLHLSEQHSWTREGPIHRPKGSIMTAPSLNKEHPTAEVAAVARALEAQGLTVHHRSDWPSKVFIIGTSPSIDAARLIEALSTKESDLRAENERLRHAGAGLANIAYNLAQRSHLTDAERSLLDFERERWDRASLQGSAS
jgi:hypothetical protein